MIKVAINGFGRIGRLALRDMSKYPGDFEVAVINSTRDAQTLAHLLKYDSSQGRFDGKIEVLSEKTFSVNGRTIEIISQRDPKDLPWGAMDIDVVLECTGKFADKEQAKAHYHAGAKKVIISAPAKGKAKTVVFGVNHEIIEPSDVVISGASCTTNCLAPMAKVLSDNFGIESGLINTIHAYTNDQNTLDGTHAKGDMRRARTAALNIVPNSTGAAKAIGKVLPELEGKLDGSAQRVPVATGSLTELVCTLDKKVTVEEINSAMKKASDDSFGYTEDEIVSSDVIGITYGSLFDATQTKVLEVGDVQLVKVVAWYDNEMSYAAQLVRVAKYVGQMI